MKRFNATKGYGFIQPGDGGPDVFVHIGAVERAGMAALKEGQKVAFDVVPNRKTGKLAADKFAGHLIWECRPDAGEGKGRGA